MISIRGLQDSTLAVELLIARIESCRAQRGWSEAELARQLNWDQSRLNKCMNQRQRFTVPDLDAIAAVFSMTVPELFFDIYGQWDRRSGVDRRKGERRNAHKAIYDPKVELSPEIERAAFPTRDEHDNE